jgi:uncharacterized protein YggE
MRREPFGIKNPRRRRHRPATFDGQFVPKLAFRPEPDAPIITEQDMFAKFAAAPLAALLLLAHGPVLADDGSPARAPRTLSVGGSGEVGAVPDTAMVTAGVTTEASDARTALDSNSRAVSDVFAALAQAGVAPADMQTRNFVVSPRYERSQRGEIGNIVGYQVTNQVAVRVRALEKLGLLLDRLVSAGANQMGGIAFYVDKADALTDEARKRAVADARRKAELYAAEAGAKVGRVLAISESGARPPQPVFRTMAVADRAEAVPVARGEQTVSASVTITYELE